MDNFRVRRPENSSSGTGKGFEFTIRRGDKIEKAAVLTSPFFVSASDTQLNILIQLASKIPFPGILDSPN